MLSIGIDYVYRVDSVFRPLSDVNATAEFNEAAALPIETSRIPEKKKLQKSWKDTKQPMRSTGT